MAADGVAAAKHFPDHAGISDGHAADLEERALGAVAVERVEDRLGDPRHGAVVEGQHDLLRLQEARLLGPARDVAVDRAGGSVDLDDALDAEAAGTVSTCRGGLCGRRTDRENSKKGKRCGACTHEGLVSCQKLFGAGRGALSSWSTWRTRPKRRVTNSISWPFLGLAGQIVTVSHASKQVVRVKSLHRRRKSDAG